MGGLPTMYTSPPPPDSDASTYVAHDDSRCSQDASVAGKGDPGLPGPSGETDTKRVASIKDFARVFTYATKLDCVLMVGAVSASVGAGITVPVMNLILGSLAGDFDSFGAGLPKDDFSRRVDRMSFILCVLFLARFALVYAYKLCFRLIGLRMSAAIRLDYLRSLLAQSVHVLDSMPSGTGAATITSTANTLQLGISEKLGILVEYNATIVGAIFVALSTSGVLTLVTGTAALFIGLVLSVLLPRINKVVEKSQEMEAMEASFATEAFAAIRMVTSCGAEGRIAAKHAERVRNIKQASQGLQPLLAAQFGLGMVRRVRSVRRS